MSLHDLLVRARAGQVEAIELISLEGGLYLLEAHVGGLRLPLRDEQGEPLHPRSLEHARELLHGLPFRLAGADPHDEMCGLPSLH
ncbi:hypothetical protein A9179_18475 [Pseudomonas alcaligenes]|uniref:Cation transporter n=1 Tax=Aquipseudomonas alcaligenes TaxID=43263 RepID=A0ABR7S3W8_AQUAC|nr:DUF6482 family protein [Pseudomonas alcaligenes]MBC9252260.1 hypothetical protein [Pseudomonas alcaligenes]